MAESARNTSKRLTCPLRSIATFILLSGVMVAHGGGTGTAAENPCQVASLEPSVQLHAVSPDPSKKLGNLSLRDADPRHTLFDVLWRHRAPQGRLLTPLARVSPRTTEDVGEIAIMQDEGDLITPPNTFDIQLTGQRFVPRAGGGYDITRTDSSFRTPLGDRVPLGDDDSVVKNLPFAFNFFGTTQTMAFINSDGNITFGEGDRSSSPRDIGRLVLGAPRVAPFLADLDPSVGGMVFFRASADAFTATWCGVPVFGSTRQATMQASLSANGTVEMKYGDAPPWSATDGVVGVSPGHADTFLPVDLSTTATRTIAGDAGAIGEWFSERPDLDLVELAQKFCRTHTDGYEQLVIWTDTDLSPASAFSFEVNVANEVAGIGLELFDFSNELGSTGRRLRSLVQMDAVSKFPDDPTRKFHGENNTLSILGQEVGHRWLALLQFTDQNHQRSDALLGRDLAHWSFFFNSDGSVMEGNRIQDLGGGAFKTVAAVEKYSLLDQYAMGLVRDIDVPPLFYVENPTNVQGGAEADSAPKVGVTFNGTRRNVLIDDVIEAMGRRQPSTDDSPKIHRQAFVFVVGKGKSADPAAIAKIDRIRRAWDTFFAQATDRRARVETRLRPPT